MFYTKHRLTARCSVTVLIRQSFSYFCHKHKHQQEILLDCNQSNVLLARNIFFFIFLRAFCSFRFVLETRRLLKTHLLLYRMESRLLLKVFPELCKILPDFTNSEEKNSITVNDVSCHLSCYTSTHASIWHRYGDMAPRI